jgi:hypothetical protein
LFETHFQVSTWMRANYLSDVDQSRLKVISRELKSALM